MARKNTGRDEAASALRAVTPERAFYFYRGIGQPLGLVSKSLDEFAAAVKDVDPSSVKFHLERGDFESWFKMLGDKSLAEQAAALRGGGASPGELRAALTSIVTARVARLRRTAGSK